MDKYSIPGWKSIQEFAIHHQIPRTTLYTQMRRGYCKWPKMSITGNQRDHPLYDVWWAMKARCTKPNTDSYPDYGGRGIQVCSRWYESFADFVSDMGDRPEGYSIDRINNNGNYEPDNCRWADDLTQRNNQRPKGKNGTGIRNLKKTKQYSAY